MSTPIQLHPSGYNDKMLVASGQDYLVLLRRCSRRCGGNRPSATCRQISSSCITWEKMKLSVKVRLSHFFWNSVSVVELVRSGKIVSKPIC